jgi:hypothetical protein
MPPKKKVPKRISTMEDFPSENTKRTTKALRPLQAVDPVDPDELDDLLALPDVSKEEVRQVFRQAWQWLWIREA